MMNKLFVIVILSVSFQLFSQEPQNYKKRVLETTEINELLSFYTQRGDNAAVTGGIGTEELTNIANNINISIPLNEDDVLNIDATVSAYSSASSGNLNPFSGASSGGDDDDEEDDDKKDNDGGATTGSPWVASSGASKQDVWLNGNFSYSHSSDSRNEIVQASLSVANEFDYTSLGGGVGFTKLFNEKNTEIGIKANLFLDTWHPEYPTEIKTYVKSNGNLNADFFNNVPILDKDGNPTDKYGNSTWKPIQNKLIVDKGRNTYAFSLSFSQILSKNAQLSIFSDVTYQKGWLANPMQRVYFSDVENYYIGNAGQINNYTNSANTGVFQLADDIERLPDNRLKIPIGMRFNYYINEHIVLRTYYRYYFDDWDIKSHTLNIEIPIKIGGNFTLYPNYRFYNQTKATYFAAYEMHLSTDNFYTSDYDLSAFSAQQYGMGIKYTDILSSKHLWKFGLKNLNLNYNYYSRDTGLKAHIVSFGSKFILL